MLFHTWNFLLFFAVVYGVYLPLRGTRFYLHWLLAASYFFYGWWSPFYLVLILFCTASNYVAVRMMARGRRRKLWLTIGITNSLAVLGFFKYANFFIENLNALFGFLNLSTTVDTFPFLLPVGISFFTFQAMSYSIDYYRGHVEEEPSFIRFATFVSLFPQLVAGPIERASTLLPQLKGKPQIYKENITEGLSLFFVGLFKKLALADYLAMYVDSVYAMPELYGGTALLAATFAFGWQIYFDFSGYTDMARGVARMMGFKLMLNFNHPYLATGLGDFWGRWHISLSQWFRDYVYIPLGGNRRGVSRTYINMFLTMVISGLWHGAAWTFIIWGVLHAVGRFLTRALEHKAFYRERIPRFVKQLWVFLFVTFTWIFFRAESLGDAWLIVRTLFTDSFSDPQFPLLMLALCLVIWVYQFIYESRARRLVEIPVFKVAVMVVMIVYLFIFSGAGGDAFIYFQF